MNAIVIHDCPFCGSDNVVIEEILPGQVFVACEECGATGPDGTDAETAIATWNMRKQMHVEPA